ncbi:hypothetical protein HGRIS_005455 [Hohenbuehelia grisea]|uniref:GH16 domain-containing protein n=1 Tax=Hohenbuehelia grisea TaxID=104357 RepID=A0ABR3JYN4_9AGAR
MPQGCGTWPVIWETKEQDWPSGGEVDILEGVNDVGPNRAVLHTTPNCTMPEKRLMAGATLQNDCDWSVNWNAGCGVSAPDAKSYGKAFNKNGGGWYAIERTDEHFKDWFWPRDDSCVPADVKVGAGAVTPEEWGLPFAYFPNTQCDLEKHFQENNIIINLTLCGDWAGQRDVYASSGCPATCEEIVADPKNFVDAYFDFAAVRVYTLEGSQ